MDAITKESKEWRDALQFAGKWEPGPCERCHALDFNRAETLPSGNVAVHHIEHEHPVSDISPDLLYAIRRAIEARGYQWAMRYWDTGEGNEYEFAINDGMKLVGFAQGTTEEEVSIRAAASLQEAK